MMKKRIVMLVLLLVVLTCCAGCQNEQTAPQEVASQEDYEKLPEDQKENELDKALAEVRRENKEMKPVQKDGYVIASGMSGVNIPGYIDPPNDHITETELGKIYKTAYAYLRSKGMEITQENDHYMQDCYDPRMNQIYKDEDKGVAAGYKNKDIYILEYETDTEDVYSYLLLVRDKTGKWKVLHDGTSYKE